MKLREIKDRALFLADVARLDLLNEDDESLDIPPELSELFIKHRKPLIKKMVDFRKSQLSSSSWRASRWSHLIGIKKWHRSVEGKRFHRSLGRFLSTRIPREGTLGLQSAGDTFESLGSQSETLKAISSVRTHLYINLDYYNSSIQEDADLLEFITYSVPILNEVEIKVFDDTNSTLTEDELELLLRLTDRKELCKAIAEVYKKDSDYVYNTYISTCNRRMKQGKKITDTYFMTESYRNLITWIG